MDKSAYFETDYVKITWDNELGAVVSVWTGYVGGDRGLVQIGYSHITELIAQKKTNKWLSDIRDLRVVDPPDQAWILEVGHGEMAKAGLRHLAIVMPQSPTARSTVNRVISNLGEVELEIGSFTDPEEAARWLESR